MDIEKAKNDPASVFKTPDEVLEHEEISLEDKRAILKQWEYDELEMAVAEEENMAAEGRRSLLRSVHLALEKLEET